MGVVQRGAADEEVRLRVGRIEAMLGEKDRQIASLQATERSLRDDLVARRAEVGRLGKSLGGA